MSKVIAHTNLDPVYPGYVNVTSTPDGGVAIHLRGDPTRRPGIYVCGFPAEKGKYGRCTPGDENCNNHCNMAPQKGPMQDNPKPCEMVFSGSEATLALSAADWARLKALILAED